MNSEIELLKKVYANSKASILIADLNGNIIWKSRELPEYMKNISPSELLKSATDGENYVKINSITYKIQLTVCPDINGGTLIAELPQKCCAQELVSNPVFTSFFAGHDALMRQIIFGIVNSTDRISTALIDNDMYNDLDYLNVTVGNCRRLLKTQMNISEIIKLSECGAESALIDLSKTAAEFCDILQDMLRSKPVTFDRDIEPDLYISADADRLTSCLLCLFLLAYGNEASRNYIEFSAHRRNNSAVLTVNAQAQGHRTTSEENPDAFSSFSEYGELSELESEEYLLQQFCNTFNASFMHFRNDDTRSYAITFPLFEAEASSVSLKSPKLAFRESKFSKYHIALSDIVKYRQY